MKGSDGGDGGRFEFLEKKNLDSRKKGIRKRRNRRRDMLLLNRDAGMDRKLLFSVQSPLVGLLVNAQKNFTVLN